MPIQSHLNYPKWIAVFNLLLDVEIRLKLGCVTLIACAIKFLLFELKSLFQRPHLYGRSHCLAAVLQGSANISTVWWERFHSISSTDSFQPVKFHTFINQIFFPSPSHHPQYQVEHPRLELVVVHTIFLPHGVDLSFRGLKGNMECDFLNT